MTEGPYKLPEGWRWVRLGEVCRPTERRDPTKEPGSTFLYVDISAVDNASGEIVAVKEVLGKDAPSRARKGIRADDVIFATTRPYLKNIAIVPPELDGQICSTGFCVLRADKVIIDPRFLFYVCRSDMFVEQLSQGNMRGASYPAVTDKDVFNSIIPLPPLEEQRRIVARIEALMARVREARRLRKEATEDAERLWQSVLAETFPRPGSELPKGWRWVRLGEVCEVWDRLRKPVKKKERIAGDTPYCGANGIIDYVKGYTHEGEFVLLAEDGGFYCPGEPSAYIMQGRFWANNHVHIIRGKTGRLLNALLQSYLVAADLRPFLTGATRPKLTQGAMISIPVPLPPLSEQRRIVAYLEAVQEKIKALKEAQAATEAELKRLEQAILERAFRGEL
mgnify:CR=1 FL=1